MPEIPELEAIRGFFNGQIQGREITSAVVRIPVVEGVRTYDFSSVTLYWLVASILSLLIAASLWRVLRRPGTPFHDS